MLHSWPSTKNEAHKELQPWWSSRDEIANIDGIVIKGRRLIIPTSLQDKAISQLHINHRGIDKARMLACQSMYWISMNAEIEETIHSCPHMP